MRRLHNRVFIAGLRGAIRGFRQDTLQSGEILRDHFADSFRSSFLRILASDSVIGGFLYYILHLIRFFGRFYRKKIIYRRWHKKYRFLKGFLNNDPPENISTSTKGRDSLWSSNGSISM
ncbi:MAG: hypothetical protein DDT41_01613 [candidate division WS2 bacterium]|nr:hypothetical protein [Candidatus Psychracetigena formicireducens]